MVQSVVWLRWEQQRGVPEQLEQQEKRRNKLQIVQAYRAQEYRRFVRQMRPIRPSVEPSTLTFGTRAETATTFRTKIIAEINRH